MFRFNFSTVRGILWEKNLINWTNNRFKWLKILRGGIIPTFTIEINI
jgi:hypothetical protein